MKAHIASPRNIFIINVILYCLFLVLFAFVIRIDSHNKSRDEHQSTNCMYTLRLFLSFKFCHQPSKWELILFFWYLTLVLEELRQEIIFKLCIHLRCYVFSISLKSYQLIFDAFNITVVPISLISAVLSNSHPKVPLRLLRFA